MNREPTLSQALAALAPYFPNLVIIGGTAHRLFPLHPLGVQPSFELLTTEDVDIAVSLELASADDSQLLDALTNAGFQERIGGADKAECTYVLRSRPTAYLQFLAPLMGSGEKRDGKPDVHMRVAGIQAKKLRAVDLLLHEPWLAMLDAPDGAATVPVANPCAYLVQKLVKLHERQGPKLHKDVLYVFDTLTIFGDKLAELGADARRLVPDLTAKQRRRVRDAIAKYFSATSDACRGAAVLAASQRGNPPSAAQLADACRMGLADALLDLY